MCKTWKKPLIGHEANQCPHTVQVKRNIFAKNCKENYEYENGEFIQQSALSDAPIADNYDNAIPSLSRVEVWESPTLARSYKNMKLRVTLDTWATAFLVTKSIWRSSGMPI